MIKLLDGPAAGAVLDWSFSPRYLRVVVSRNSLDLRICTLGDLIDCPFKHCDLYVYQWGQWQASTEDPGTTLAECYRHVPLPEELRESFRNGAAWRAWCIRNQEEPDSDNP